MATLVTRLVFAGKEEEVPRARRAVLDRVRAWGVPLDDETVDAVRLVASELVTNAVVHGEGPVTVVLHHRPGRLVIEVLDKSPAMPRMGCAQAAEESGRGLELVNLLAARWGWEPCDSGKRVWAEIALRSSVPAVGAAVLPRLSMSPREPDTAVKRESYPLAVA